MEYHVPVLPVFAAMVSHVVPPLVDRSILYPVIGEPPSLSGACQEILICDKEINGVASSVGWFGTVAGLVVAETVLEGELVPAEFIAETR